MAQDGITKRDWALFREKVPEWQEAYMEKLVKEYVEMLSGDGAASDKFWELDKRIKADKRRKSVVMEMCRSEMLYNILDLMREGTITVDDLDDFSEHLRGTVKLLMEGW
ncbi:MAG: multidrug transporter [Lachnospiraceae bacterium]|nr:multidrug transporter [Lachnospiraceae bacterium]